MHRSHWEFLSAHSCLNEKILNLTLTDKVDRRFPVISTKVHVSSGRDQFLDNARTTDLGSPHQRGKAAVILQIDVGASTQ